MSVAFDLESIVRKHQASVWSYLRLLGCDRAEAEDLAQEVFLSVLEHPFDDYDDRATAAYLRNAARFAFLRAKRMTEQRENKEMAASAERALAAFMGDDEGDARINALLQCVNEQDERTRQVIELRYRDGMSGADIGSYLAMSEAAVNTLLSRSRQALRRCMESKIKRS